MHDISAFGDILVDFIPFPNLERGNLAFECQVGGTSANFAVGTRRLGLQTVLIGKIGNDVLGKEILRIMKKEDVDVSHILIDDERSTTMTFVALKDGERSFSFARYHSAETNIQQQEIDVDAILDTRILSLTGMSFTNEPIRSVTMHLLKEAVRRKVYTAIDINYREFLWKNTLEFAQIMKKAIPYLNLYKSSEEELFLLTGERDLEIASAMIQAMGPSLVCISCGCKGAYIRAGNNVFKMNTYDLPRVDTTGAGDSFMSAICYQLCQFDDMRNIGKENFPKIIDFCNAAGAFSITKRGGTTSMPTLSDIQNCQKNATKLVMPW